MKETTTMWIAIVVLGIAVAGLLGWVAALEKQVNAAFWLENAREIARLKSDTDHALLLHDGLYEKADGPIEAADEAQDAVRERNPFTGAELLTAKELGELATPAVADEYSGQIEVGQVWRPIDGGGNTRVTDIRRSQSGKRKIFHRRGYGIRTELGEELEPVFLDRFAWVSNGE